MTYDEATAILKEQLNLVEESDDSRPELHQIGNPAYVCTYGDDHGVTLDGAFTADQLEALAIWLRHHRSES